MPRHYAIGENAHMGEVAFSGTKKKKVKFVKPFTKIPAISLTVADSSSQPPYRYSVALDHFWIRFTNKYTGIVVWEAKEMN